MTIMIQDKNKREYSMAEIAKICDRKYAAIAKWHSSRGFRFLEEFIEYAKTARVGYLESIKQKEARIAKGLATKKELRIPDEIADFPRKPICQRNIHLHEECEHYSSCASSRVFHKKHHSRFKKDGSCYEGINIQSTRRASASYRINV